MCVLWYALQDTMQSLLGLSTCELPGNMEISTAKQCKLVGVYLVNSLCPLSTLISSRENRILGLGARL
jgi:hypothetical protein